MKKFLIILGSVFLAIIVIVAGLIAFVAVRGTRLDKESKAYADAAIPPIVTTWSEKALLDQASPEFKQAVTIDELDRLFRWISTLGAPQKIEPAEGDSLMSATTEYGKRITADYNVKATFAKGDANIHVVLIKHSDNWQIMGFRSIRRLCCRSSRRLTLRSLLDSSPESQHVRFQLVSFFPCLTEVDGIIRYHALGTEEEEVLQKGMNFGVGGSSANRPQHWCRQSVALMPLPLLCKLRRRGLRAFDLF